MPNQLVATAARASEHDTALKENGTSTRAKATHASFHDGTLWTCTNRRSDQH